MLPVAILTVAVSISASAQSVIRTADPITRGLKLTDFPPTIKVADNVYTYEDFHAGDEKFTTTNMRRPSTYGQRSPESRPGICLGS